MPRLFVNGEGMRGGAVHHTIAEHPFVGAVRTAPSYRFYSIRDEFPGLAPAAAGQGGAVTGEVYEVPLATLRERFLPAEPPELELGVIELEDGSSVLGMVLRRAEAASGAHRDITQFGGWRAYRGT